MYELVEFSLEGLAVAAITCVVLREVFKVAIQDAISGPKCTVFAMFRGNRG